jgi:hypothetical protein
MMILVRERRTPLEKARLLIWIKRGRSGFERANSVSLIDVDGMSWIGAAGSVLFQARREGNRIDRGGFGTRRVGLDLRCYFGEWSVRDMHDVAVHNIGGNKISLKIEQ